MILLILMVIVAAVVCSVCGFILHEQYRDHQFSNTIRMISQTPDDESKVINKPEGTRGITIVAGGPVYGELALKLIQRLQDLQCSLPIYVYCLNESERQCPSMQQVEKLATVNVLTNPDLTGWSAKSEAMAECPIQHVLLLDADNWPLRNPEYLFDLDIYKEKKCILWPDVDNFEADNARYSLWGMRTPVPVCSRFSFTTLRPVLEHLGLGDLRTYESGQVLMDTIHHAKSLAYTQLLNQNHKNVYKTLHGDKDTYAMGCLLSKIDFHTVEYQPGIAGILKDNDIFEGRSLLQRSPDDGEPLFVHFCGKNKKSHTMDDMTHKQVPNDSNDIKFYSDATRHHVYYDESRVPVETLE